MEVRTQALRQGALGRSPKRSPDMQGCLEWVVNRRECHARVSTKEESFTKNPPGEVKLFLEFRIIRGCPLTLGYTWQRCSLASALSCKVGR